MILLWVDQLTAEYQESREALNDIKKELGNTKQDNDDKMKINSMYRDMTFIIKWLEEGREPESLQGMDRLSTYQLTDYKDMELYPSLDLDVENIESDKLNDDDKKEILDVLMLLSARQRQCFVLHKAYEMSINDIALEIGISKSTAQTHIKRAEIRIKEEVKN